MRVRDGYQTYVLDYHPFDVVGWDGYVYPWTFSIHDFEPITGRIHMPPPSHQTFAGPNFVICSFCPRKLDFDPNAVPIPYHHSNLQSEEMLYYVDGSFSSRKGIEVGSVTLHPSGLPHGPHPGLAEKSLGMTETHELAVMCDTFHPLKLTRSQRGLDDGKYMFSWAEDPSPGDGSRPTTTPPARPRTFRCSSSSTGTGRAPSATPRGRGPRSRRPGVYDGAVQEKFGSYGEALAARDSHDPRHARPRRRDWAVANVGCGPGFHELVERYRPLIVSSGLHS